MVSKVARSYFFFHNPFQKLLKRSSATHWDGKAFSSRKTVCIIRANDCKENSQAARGIVSALMDCIEHPHIIPVVGDNNIAELTELLYDVLHQHSTIDMIFSLGSSSTKIAQKVTAELDRNIPIFFMLVDEKTASHVMKLSSSVTGIVSPVRNYAEQFKSFFYFTQYDRTKKVLVPRPRFSDGLRGYNESAYLISFFASHKVEAELVDITCSQDLRTEVRQLLSEIGLLAIPQDTVLETYADEFIEMANERRIPLFSSSLASVELGSGIGFGRPIYEFSKELALLAKPILVHGVHPSSFPVVRINNWVGKMGINREAAAQQGLKLNMERVCADENVMLL